MFSTLSQTNRFLQLTTPLGPDVLTPLSFSGVELLSQPFEYTLRLISSELDIDPKKLLHKPMTLEIRIPGSQEPRYFNGIVAAFQGEETQKGKRYYNALLIPWFSCLQHTTDCRIFLGKSVVEIFEMLSKEYGFFHFDKDGIKQKHLPHEQNTQYNESAFSFLSRLLEEEGIFYFFHHEKGKHIMMLADKPDIHKACDSPKIGYNAGSERGQNHSITDWRRGYQLYSGKHANIDYNYEKPYQGLEGEHKCSAELPLADKYETYCSAGQHQRQDMGDVAAKRQFHAQEFQHELISGSSNHAGFSAGCQFELSKHSNEKELGKYVLYQVKHSASDGSYLSALGAGGGGQHYSNEFICFPAKIPYSPLSITPKPQIPGPQTATVVGEGEIDTDAMGRIQVQFHWIRNKKKHEQSSCWVRVAQSWSGNGYGTWFLPRVNQEVVVHFIDGDPDRPLVTGCVYHKEARLPFALPGNKTQSGIKTQGGGSNELRFDDKKDAQEIYIHAQKDFKRVIENDETVIVVKGDHKMSIEAGKSLLEASKSITFKVGASAIQITPDKINFYSPAISQNKEPIIED